MHPALLALCNQSVSIAPLSARDSFNQHSYSTAVTSDAYVEYHTTMVRASDGQEKVSSAQVYVDGSVAVALTSRITLPDGQTPQILAIDELCDENGDADHKVIYT